MVNSRRNEYYFASDWLNILVTRPFFADVLHLFATINNEVV